MVPADPVEGEFQVLGKPSQDAAGASSCLRDVVCHVFSVRPHTGYGGGRGHHQGKEKASARWNSDFN